MGSSVLTLTGEFLDGATDLAVKVQGGTLKILRNYFDGKWHFNFDSRIELAFATGVADPEPVSIDYNGTLYEKHDGRCIFGTYQIVIAQRDGQGRPTGYRYEEKGGRWELFGQAIGEVAMAMTAFGDRNGTVGKIRYDGQGRPAGMADRHDRQMIWIDYDGAGWISSVRDSANRQVGYVHEGGRLTQVTDLLGAQAAYRYDGRGRIVAYTDPMGRTETITYNADGLVTRVEDGAGDWRRFDYGYDTQSRQYYTLIETAGGREVRGRCGLLRHIVVAICAVKKMTRCKSPYAQ